MQNRRGAREAGIIAAILVMAAVLWTVLAPPSVGAVADGSYSTTMEQLSLEWVDGRDGTGQRVEQFAYKSMDAAMLLRPGQPAIAWPAMLVRLVTEPFGRLFDTRLLAAAYALMIALGTGLAVSGLYRRSRLAALLWAVCAPLLMTHSAISGYINSLYSVGTAIACLMLFAGMLVHTFCLPERCGTLHMLGVAFTGMLLLTSGAQMLAFAPFVACGVILAIVHCCPAGRERLVHAVASLLALLICAVSVTTCIQNDVSVNSDSAGYLAVFQGYLPAADDAGKVLDGLGVDEKYAADSGRSYYEADENFAFSPRSDEAQSELFSHIGLKDRLIYCLKNPDTVFNIIEQNPVSIQDAYSGYLVNDDGETRYMRMSVYSILETISGQGGFQNHLNKMAAGIILAALLMLITKWRGGLNKLGLCLILLFACGAAYLPVSVALTGGVDIAQSKVFMIFTGWAAVFFAAGGAFIAGQRVFIWLASREARLAMPEPAAAPGGNMLARLDHVHVSRAGLMWLTAALCAIVCCGLLLPEKHIGGVNNGDFGRMMEQLGIYWTQPQMDDQSTQAGTQVVEDYSYLSEFHAERLTPVEPTYSLLFPSMLVRLWSAVSGGWFSTRLLAFILLALTAAGILLIVHDLYPRLGRATLPLAVGLVAMLLGENYVAWYNSLFGESSISTGIVLTIACALHLVTMERGSRKSWLWLVLLALAVRFMACSKAQMAVSLPAGLILMIALGIYHHPKGAFKLLTYGLTVTMLCGLVCWDTIGVYTKDDGISSKQTVWSSVFYGALMIADDPDAAMAEFGLDPAMKADIGKHAYYPVEDYVYAPTSQAAETELYAKVSKLSVVKYYLRHPADMLKMLNRAAEQSVELHTGFMAYTGETYGDSSGPVRFNLWRSIRPLFACRAFWQYVLLYGIALIACLRIMLRRSAKPENRLLALLFICVMMIGVFQYPLSVLGNGYADNNKQLYGFMLCHDLMLLSAAAAGARRLVRYVRGTDEKMPTQGGVKV